MTLLIMAAGLATRFGGSKQTAGFGPNGEFIMEYSIADAKKAGFDKVVFIINKSMAETFPKMIAQNVSGVETAFAVQDYDSLPDWFTVPEGRTKPYGTVHAVLAAKPYINEPFAVINADDYYGPEAFVDIAKALSGLGESGKACMLGYYLKNTLSCYGAVTRGVCTVENGVLSGIKETYKVRLCENGVIRSEEVGQEAVLDGDSVASMNIFGFMPWIFDELQKGFEEFLRSNEGELKAEYPLPVLLDGLIKSGKLSIDVSVTQAVWYGVTYQEDRDIVREKFAQLESPRDVK